jgi:ubiquinone/menaquinone biosynthesis C-methylase UbiE
MNAQIADNRWKGLLTNGLLRSLRTDARLVISRACFYSPQIVYMPTSAETYLRDFHRRCTGATYRAFGNLPARSARIGYLSSYHALAHRIPNDNASRTVLDLACGDGTLLKLLSGRGHPSTKLIGVDMSEGELAAARVVLTPDVSLMHERAQHLPLEDGSVDHILSHMALMLMDDVEQVIGEMSRVLKQGGGFAAVVGRTFLIGDVANAVNEVFRPIAKTHLQPLSIGDVRTRSETGWLELLDKGFTGIEFEDLDVDWFPTPEQLWQSLLETYDVDRMSEEARAQYRRELLTALARLQRADGTLQTGWGLRLVQARVSDLRARAESIE